MLVSSRIDLNTRLIEKSIFLFFVKAQPNETMTSWICRNALSNYSSPEKFIAPWLKKHSAMNADFDQNPNAIIVEWLIHLSPKRQSEFAPSFTLITILEVFKSTRCKFPPVVLDTTPAQQKKINPQFCPNCLKGKHKYFKLDWKFTLIFGCNECKCFLEPVCMNCKKNTQLMKLKVFSDGCFVGIDQCTSCFNTLHGEGIISMSNSLLELNSWVSDILGLRNRTKSNPKKASLLFDLCNLLTSRSSLGNIVREYFSLKTRPSLFHQMSRQERSYIIGVAKLWIDNFYFYVADINYKYQLSRRNWDSHIFIPADGLNP